MKLWYSFRKELKLASTGFYFWIELGMAIIFLIILLFVVPENFDSRSTEYLYLDVPESVMDVMLENIGDVKPEVVEIKSEGEIIKADYYDTDTRKVYILNSEADAIQLAKDKEKLGAIITLDENGQLHYEYLLQGYESEKMKNIFLVLHNKDMNLLAEHNDNQEVRSLTSNFVPLSDRQNVVPAILVFNGSLMGLFIIAAYIFLDKQEGIIKAYAVTASSVWQYLLSKVGVILVTSILSSLIIISPIMGLQPNYPMIIVFLLTTGFFASSLGLVVSSFYDNITQAFGSIYILIILFMLPSIAYFIPSWEPVWMKFIPSHTFIQGFKELIIKNGDITYVIMASLGYLAIGIVLFIYSNYRFKKTLRV